MRDYRPRCDENGVPFCSDDCQQFDGKRCRLIGFRPSGICEPWAQDIVVENQRLHAAVKVYTGCELTADELAIFDGKP